MGIASRPEVVQGEPTSCGGETPVHARHASVERSILPFFRAVLGIDFWGVESIPTYLVYFLIRL